MNELDIQLFHWLNATPDTAPWLLATARLITQQMPAVALVSLLPLALVSRRTRWQVLGVLMSMLLAWLAVRGMREWIQSTRPFAMGLGFQGLAHSASPSFPSMHATMASAWAAGLCLFAAPAARTAWLLVTAPVAVAIAWSRVYLGLHFPFDMLAGLILGGVCGALAYWLIKRSPAFEPMQSCRRPAS